jgi:hypothetical protein
LELSDQLHASDGLLPRERASLDIFLFLTGLDGLQTSLEDEDSPDKNMHVDVLDYDVPKRGL